MTKTRSKKKLDNEFIKQRNNQKLNQVCGFKRGYLWKKNRKRSGYCLRWQYKDSTNNTNIAHRDFSVQLGHLYDYPLCCVESYSKKHHMKDSLGMIEKRLKAKAFRHLPYIPCDTCTKKTLKKYKSLELSEKQDASIKQKKSKVKLYRNLTN